ncbi:MAG: hypothetical protein ACRDNK_22165 [Solirubrobacteraceae bacterium]
MASLAAPAPAEAHLRSGTIAVDYAATIAHASAPAYSARIYQSDHGLQLTLHPGHTITLIGYVGEPVFRLDASGLWINAASPTAAVTGLLKKAKRIASTAPHWRLRRGQYAASWHDARAQGLPPGIDRGDWRVPLVADGRPMMLTGSLRRFPAPSLVLWIALLASATAVGWATAVAGDAANIERAAGWLAFEAAAAATTVALVFALDSYASPGTWIAAGDEIAIIAVGIGLLVKGPPNLRLAGVIGLGLMALAVGLVHGSVFFHPIVLAPLPSTVTRALTLAGIAAGIDAAALGCFAYLRDGPSLHP